MNSLSDTLIAYFYPEDTPLRRLLLKHSMQVRDKALAILDHAFCKKQLDRRLVLDGAMLHDVGIGRCHAPSILCEGSEPYLAHGIIGAEMIRAYASEHHLDLERFARICERHTGTGITAKEIRKQGLPIPEKDYLPETPEEKLICLADKFYSKSGDMQEKSLRHIRHSMQKFGSDSVERFDALCQLFDVEF